jgi:hypothetical protein
MKHSMNELSIIAIIFILAKGAGYQAAIMGYWVDEIDEVILVYLSLAYLLGRQLSIKCFKLVIIKLANVIRFRVDCDSPCQYQGAKW